MVRETMVLRGHVRLWLHRGDGRLLWTRHTPNLIVNVGVQSMFQILAGNLALTFAGMQLGTGAAPVNGVVPQPQPSDTGLYSPVGPLVPFATTSTPSITQIVFTTTFTGTAYNTTVNEMGLFFGDPTAATPPTPQIFAHYTFPGTALNSSANLTAQWTIEE